MPDDDLISPAQAAVTLNVSLSTIDRLQAAGKLTPVYEPTGGFARRRKFKRSDVEARLGGQVAS